MKKTSFYCFGVDIGGTYTKIGLFEINISRFDDSKESLKENSPLNIYLNIDKFIINIKLVESCKMKTQDSDKSEISFINNLFERFEKILS